MVFGVPFPGKKRGIVHATHPSSMLPLFGLALGTGCLSDVVMLDLWTTILMRILKLTSRQL
jgi:hypothetical protein